MTLLPSPGESNALPRWFIVIVVAVLLGLLVYNVVENGNGGYPTTMLLGGLIGGLTGVYRKLRGDDTAKKDDGGTP